MIKEYYNRHYILLREDKVIIDTWSDGPSREKDITKAICINEKGGYQFRFSSDGEENPMIFDLYGVPLYKWDGKKVIPRDESELNTERASIIQDQSPTQLEQLRADVDFLLVMGGLS